VEEAMQAIRAAWLHAAAGSQAADAGHEEKPVQANVPAGPSRAARQAAYATA
jgi:hypothetical protein